MTTPLWASGVCAGIHAAGSRDVVYVPDNPLSHVLRELDDRFPDIRLLLATREDIFPDYTLDGFRAAFSGPFAIEEERPVEDSTRVIFRMKRRNP